MFSRHDGFHPQGVQNVNRYRIDIKKSLRAENSGGGARSQTRITMIPFIGIIAILGCSRPLPPLPWSTNELRTKGVKRAPGGLPLGEPVLTDRSREHMLPPACENLLP